MSTLSSSSVSGPDPVKRRVPRATAPHGPRPDPNPASPITRRLRASAGLPSGRAVLGGVLISASVLGIIAAYRDATVDQRSDVLVIGRAVRPGASITAADLALAPMQLASITEGRSYVDPAEVIGSTVLVALEPGDLLSPAMIAEGERSRAVMARTVGLSLNADHALGGRLNVGDRVDVFSLASSTEPATVLVRDARISAISTPSSGAIGSGGRLALSLDVADEREALAIVDADSGTGVTLVRASGDNTGVAAEPDA
ncbi:MAG: hypothetical protein GX868_02465 [Actinobacteria bacterium]|nr:hypothetical protein [Actinomycetota bacterium]